MVESQIMKAVLYCRVSTKEQAQTGYSLEAQEKACRSFAEQNSYQIVRVFVERGESAKTQDSPELQALLKYCLEHKGKVSAVIVWRVDRFTRNLRDQLNLADLLAKAGIRIFS